MENPIGGLPNLPSPSQPVSLPGPSGTGNAPDNTDADFQNLLRGIVERTNSLGQEAQGAVETKLAGGDITQVEVFSAVKKADLAMRMMMQVRNKVLEAYNEVKQMQM